MSDVFISYARSTEAQATQVAQALRGLGYQVWRDDELPAHRAYAEVIEERLRTSKAVVVMWSAEATKSQWVRAEAEVAREAGTLVQLTLDGAPLPLPFNQIQCADLRTWAGEPDSAGWRKVVASVAELVGRSPKRVRHANVGAPHAKAAAAPSAPPQRRPSRWAWAVGAGVVLLAGAGAGAWWLVGRGAAQSLRVAVAPFDIAGPNKDLSAFADGLQDEILNVLSSNQVQTVSRADSAQLRGPGGAEAVRRLGAGLVLDGAVSQANGVIKVVAHLNDPTQGTIVWSEDFQRPAAELEPLQAEVAAKATHVAADAVQARAAGLTDPVALADFVSAKERIHFDWSNGQEAAEPALRRVVAKAPQFAGGHAYLAESLAMQSYAPGNPRAAEQRAEATREAEEALRLDPKGYGAFHPLAIMRPPLDWKGRDALLQKGMTLNPTDAGYPYLESENLAFEGHLNAALETARRAADIDPLWPGPNRDLGLYLLETGRTAEGLQTFERMARLWPRHTATLSGRFWATTLFGQPDAALALLASPDTRPPDVDAPAAAVWRAVLQALKSGAAADRAQAAAGLRAALDQGRFEPGPGVVLLARLGDTPGALAAVDRTLDRIQLDGFASGVPYLFSSQTAPLRRDPHFMVLAARLGLVDDWRTSGLWPDFCAEPGLPYDCKAQAARLAKPH